MQPCSESESNKQHMSHLMTKPTKWHVRPAKTQISLGIHPIWSESSLSAWKELGSLATTWAHSEDSDQTGQMPRLIWVFAGRTCHFIGFVMTRLIWARPCEMGTYQIGKQWRLPSVHPCSILSVLLTQLRGLEEASDKEPEDWPH